jgi:predicted acetyltransferase
MKLVRPTKKYEKQWHEAINEFKKDSRSIKIWEILGFPEDLEEIINNAQLCSQGKNLSKGWVPYDIYWLIDDNKFIGIANIRHKLNDNLLKGGGHIGYEIIPSKRKLGYGNQILRLSLEKIKKLGIKKVLVTSFDKNIASWKIIEKNGGRLENKVKIKSEKGLTRRYWINL